MRKVNRHIFKFAIVLTTLVFMEGERALLFTNSELLGFFSQNHVNDIEIPNQHHFFDSFEEESFLETFRLAFSNSNFNAIKLLISIDLVQKELPSSIWQPPKLV